MIYYITDYEYEKHDLLVEEGEKDQLTGVWADRPELFFYEDNVVKAGYTVSIVNEDKNVISFYNDLILKAKDGHRLSVEEIMIFMMLLITETITQSIEYVKENYRIEELGDIPKVVPEDIMFFIIEEMTVLN